MKAFSIFLLVIPLSVLASTSGDPPRSEIDKWQESRAACYLGAETAFRDCMRGVIHDNAYLESLRFTARQRPEDCAALLDENGKPRDDIKSEQFDQCLWAEPGKDFGVDLSDVRAMIRQCLSEGAAQFNPHYDHYVIYSSEVICSLEYRNGHWGITEVTMRG